MGYVPLVIRVNELADLLGVSREALKRACREAGYDVLTVRRVIMEEPNRKGSALYLTTVDAAKVAERILGKKTELAFRKRLGNIAARQRDAFGPSVELDRPGWNTAS
jgi:hypothetical protein